MPSREYSIPWPDTQPQMSSGHRGDGTRLGIMDKTFLLHAIWVPEHLTQLIIPTNGCSRVIQKPTRGQKNICSYFCCGVVLGCSRDRA